VILKLYKYFYLGNLESLKPSNGYYTLGEPIQATFNRPVDCKVSYHAVLTIPSVRKSYRYYNNYNSLDQSYRQVYNNLSSECNQNYISFKLNFAMNYPVIVNFIRLYNL
jgi:hypothetical protein